MEIYILLIPVILLSLTIHEYMHGFIAYKLGDPTPVLSGRLTLNPLKHLDPLGTIMLFLARFGWAKPVPVNPLNFKNPVRDMAVAAFAGPASNLCAGIIAGLLIRFIFGTGELLYYNYTDNLLFLLLSLFMQINLALAFFNLIPLPPLDGSKILLHLLPPSSRAEFIRFGSAGPLIIFALFLIDALFKIPVFDFLIWFPVNLVSRILLGVSLF